MSILVVCPGCHGRFTVGDQFAGKSGPCPKCKVTISIPKKEEQVVIHTPADFASGGRTASGKLATKPITRKDAKFRPAAAAAVAGIALAILLVAWVGGRIGLFNNQIVPALGLLLVSPVIVIAGYTFLTSNDELEVYRGQTLLARAVICSVAYAVLWGLFSYVAPQVLTGEIWTWLMVAPPFFVMGSLVALASLDFDFGTGFFHYCFYVIVTVVLRGAAGLGWIWNVSNGLMT